MPTIRPDCLKQVLSQFDEARGRDLTVIQMQALAKLTDPLE